VNGTSLSMRNWLEVIPEFTEIDGPRLTELYRVHRCGTAQTCAMTTAETLVGL
jgi:hypothetical protein